MNGVAAILLICLSAIVVNAKLTIIPENIDIFGDIEDYDVILGDAKIEEKNDETGIVTAFVTFPSEEQKDSKFVIHAIKHYDFHTMPYSKATIVEGGIGGDSVTIKVVSVPGQSIKSLFRFFGEYTEKPVENRFSHDRHFSV